VHAATILDNIALFTDAPATLLALNDRSLFPVFRTKYLRKIKFRFPQKRLLQVYMDLGGG
jgi:hypothetical protein